MGSGINVVRREVYEQQILRCLLAKVKINEIAKIVGLAPDTVRKYIKDENFRAVLRDKYPEIYATVDAELCEQLDVISTILEENSRKALVRLASLIGSDNEHIALKASQDALDRFEETSKVLKTENKTEVKLDPVFLVHAAGVAKEMDQFEAPPKALPAKKETVN